MFRFRFRQLGRLRPMLGWQSLMQKVTVRSETNTSHYHRRWRQWLTNFNNFWYEYSWHGWPSNDHSSSHLTRHLLLHYLGKTEQAKYALQWTKNTSINFISLDLLPQAAGRLQGLTVMHRVYQMTFRNVDEFKKRLMKSGLVCSRTLLTLLSSNGESVSVPVFVQRADICNIFTVDSWKMDSWMNCQPKWQKCGWNTFICVILIK